MVKWGSGSLQTELGVVSGHKDPAGGLSDPFL